MTNKEIADLIYANLKDVYEVTNVEITEHFKDDTQPYKEVTIWIYDETEANSHHLLSNFELPNKYDEKVVQRFATASIKLFDLKESYEN